MLFAELIHVVTVSQQLGHTQAERTDASPVNLTACPAASGLRLRLHSLLASQHLSPCEKAHLLIHQHSSGPSVDVFHQNYRLLEMGGGGH